MRMFFIFLLLLNVVFAGWQYYQPATGAAEVAPLPGTLKTLVLLSESGPLPLKVVDNESDVVEAEADVQPDVAGISPQEKQIICFTLGPFGDEAQVKSIQQELSSHVNTSEIRKRVEKELYRYWIYFPETSSRAEAIEISKSLARNKIKDYYIVHGGEHNNRVSLGHFREKMHADRRVRQLQKLGYEPQVQPIYRDYEVYWLDYAVLQQQLDDGDPVAAYAADEVSRLSRDCNE